MIRVHHCCTGTGAKLMDSKKRTPEERNSSTNNDSTGSIIPNKMGKIL